MSNSICRCERKKKRVAMKTWRSVKTRKRSRFHIRGCLLDGSWKGIIASFVQDDQQHYVTTCHGWKKDRDWTNQSCPSPYSMLAIISPIMRLAPGMQLGRAISNRVGMDSQSKLCQTAIGGGRGLVAWTSGKIDTCPVLYPPTVIAAPDIR